MVSHNGRIGSSFSNKIFLFFSGFSEFVVWWTDHTRRELLFRWCWSTCVARETVLNEITETRLKRSIINVDYTRPTHRNPIHILWQKKNYSRASLFFYFLGRLIRSGGRRQHALILRVNDNTQPSHLFILWWPFLFFSSLPGVLKIPCSWGLGTFVSLMLCVVTFFTRRKEIKGTNNRFVPFQ